jgi:transcriptional regulator with XRE-family HTH domain
MIPMALTGIGKRIREARLAVRPVPPKQGWLAAQIWVSHAVLSNWERGRHDPSPEHVARIAKVLGIQESVLTEGGHQPLLGPPMIPVGFPMVRLPYAGEVPTSEEWGDPLQSIDFVELDVRFEHPKRFVARVVGTSCWPALRQGDLTVWHSDPNPTYGLIVLAQRRGDHGCTVKQLLWDSVEQRPRLAPINPEAKPPDDGDGWGVIARLVAVIRRRDGLEQSWLLNDGLRPSHLVDDYGGG